MKKLFIAIIAATILGNLWLLQLFVFKSIRGIGAAAPLYDKFMQTGSVSKALEIFGEISIVAPTFLLYALIFLSFFMLLSGILVKSMRFTIPVLSLISIGILILYLGPNIGLPKIVAHKRLGVFMAYAYTIVFTSMYFFIIEKGILKSIFKNTYFHVSVTLICIASIFTIAITPRWIDSNAFWENLAHIEYKEFPYLVYRIEDNFQPFSFTVVSYVQEFPQVISKGYHVNTQDLVLTYDPRDKELKIPTEYIFVFVENVPKKYRGLGEYWYRWRRDIMLKLKDWIAIYSQNHDNIRLWYSSQWVEVYFIDNRSPEGSLLRQRESMKEVSR